MADWVTISSLATAGGTLVLAAATFASVRSANRAARVAGCSLLLGIRPPARVLAPRSGAGRGGGPRNRARVFRVAAGTALVEDPGQAIYLAMPLRSVGAGIAVSHGWYLDADRIRARPAGARDFRRQTRDLYVASGDTSFWRGGLYAADERLKAEVRRVLGARERLMLDLLYGDHQGGQRTISRFIFHFRGARQLIIVLRHWSLDAADPHAAALPAPAP